LERSGGDDLLGRNNLLELKQIAGGCGALAAAGVARDRLFLEGSQAMEITMLFVAVIALASAGLFYWVREAWRAGHETAQRGYDLVVGRPLDR
jgi:hypothetical protein